jgi:hypothetical protein
LYTVRTTTYSSEEATASEYYYSCNSKTTVTAVSPTGTDTLELGAPTGRAVLDVWGQEVQVAWQSNDTEVASIMNAQILAANQTQSNTGMSQPKTSTVSGFTQTRTPTATGKGQATNSTMPGQGGKKSWGNKTDTAFGGILIVVAMLAMLSL